MKNKFIILIAILFLISISTAFAKSFDVEVTPVSDKIEIDQEAVFNITVKNRLDTKETFRIRNSDYPTWDVKTVPLTNPISVRVDPQSENTIQVYVRSLNTQKTPIGTYSVTTRIDLQREEEIIDVPLTVAIISTQSLIDGYIPNVKSALIIPRDVDPRQPLEYKVTLTNFNPIEYKDLKIKIHGTLINEERTHTLGPVGDSNLLNPESQVSFTITENLDRLTKPQSDKIQLEVFYQDRLLDSQASELKIIEYVSKETISEENLLLKSIKTLRVTSNNQNYQGVLKSEISSIGKLFTSVKPDAEIGREDDKLFYVWQVDLSGDNEVIVVITKNYRPLVIIILLFIILLALYFTFRSPIVVKKEVVRIHKLHGGVSNIKVLIKVKNRGKKEIDDVEINDRMPTIAELEKDVSVGSLKPIKYSRAGNNLIIKWKLEKLVPGDERLLSYKFKSRLPIVGEYSLLSATAHYAHGKRHMVTHSNSASVD